MLIISCMVIATGIVGVLSLCKAAGRADRWMEDIQGRKEE